MKKFNNYEESRKSADYTASEKLPKGAYVAKVMAVKYEEGSNGNSDQIALQFDVSEGDYKDFFKKQYEANQKDDKKWKGSVRIWVPSDDGSERDTWTKNAFAKWTAAFEKSNDGYTWDWDEKKWKGKTVGLVFRETGTVINGNNVVYTEVAFPIEASRVRDGSAPEAKFKAKNGYTSNASVNNAATAKGDSFMEIPDGIEEEVPF